MTETSEDTGLRLVSATIAFRWVLDEVLYCPGVVDAASYHSEASEMHSECDAKPAFDLVVLQQGLLMCGHPVCLLASALA